MFSTIQLALQAFIEGINAFKELAAVYKADAKLKWAQSLQAGLEPLEQGKPTSDAEKAAAVKAVADAWKSMP